MRRRGVSPTRRVGSCLPYSLQGSFDALVEARGVQAAAELLGSSTSTIERLRYGGTAAPEATGRVVEAIQGLPRDAWTPSRWRKERDA